MVKPNNNSLKVFPYLISSSSGDTEHTLLTVIYASCWIPVSLLYASSLYVVKDLCVFVCLTLMGSDLE